MTPLIRIVQIIVACFCFLALASDGAGQGYTSTPLFAGRMAPHLIDDNRVVRTSPPTHFPTVDWSMNNADLQSPTLCEASCFAASYSFSTVPYFSLDQPRNVTLVYNGDQANPRPFIYADVYDGGDGTLVRQYTLSATVNGAAVTFLNGSTSVTLLGPPYSGVTVRVTGQFDARSYSTDVYPLSITVRITYADNAVVTKTTSTQIMIINEASSQIAKGWTVAGLQRLRQTTSPGYMITNGDGGATRFSALGVVAADYTKLTYDSPSATYTRTYPDGSRALFNVYGTQISFVEPNGLTKSFMYDANGRIQNITDPYRKQPNGSATSIGLYYGTNGIAGVQEPGADGTQWMGRTTAFVVDGNRCLVSAEDPDHIFTRFTCDGSGRLSTITNRKGGVTTLVYDPTSWKLSQTIEPQVAVDAGGGATTLVNPVISYIPWQTQTPATVTSISARVTDPVGRATRFVPNRFGQAIDITDPLGAHTTLTMNGIRPTAITHPNGSTDRFRYDAFGRMIMSKPAGKDSTTYDYMGPLGQLSGIGGPGARWEYREYDTQNRLSKISYDVEQTQWVQFYYGSYTQRPSTVYDNNSNSTNYFYDAQFGNTTQVIDQAGRTTTTTYDAYGRVATVGASGQATRSIGYDALNRVTSLSDGVNPATIITYDSLFQRDLQDGNGNVYHTDHNAVGWVTAQCEASSCVTARYNSVGELTSSTNRRGQMVNLTRDAFGRITSKSGGGTVPATYTYSTNQKLIVKSNGIETDSVRLFPGSDTAAPSDTTVIWIKPDSVQAARRYQIIHTGIRRLAGTITTSITSNTSVTFKTRQFSIAANGHLNWINDGFNTTSFGYNAVGLRASVTYPSSIGLRTENYTSVYSPWSTTFDNSAVGAGFHRSYHYDAQSKIDKIQSYPSSGVTETTYAYDQLGQLATAIVRTSCSPLSDDIDWGTSYSCGVTQSSESYTYDGMGNRTDHGAQPSPQWNRYQSFNGSSFSYDLEGNVIQKYNPSGHNRQYFWNAENQLDSAMYDTWFRTFYEYNASGKPARIWDGDVNGKHVQRYLIWDGDHLLAEFNPDGTRITDYIYNPGIDQPFAHTLGATTPTGIRYYQQDGLGNVTGTAENGAVSQSVTYDAWGTPTIGGNADSRLLWKGLMWEGGFTSLYFVRNRWYDPEVGRFMSEDPIGHSGGLNLYAFAGNDPVNASDPTGTMQYDSHGAVCSIYAQCGDPMAVGGEQIGGAGAGAANGVDPLTIILQACRQVDCSQIMKLLDELTKTRKWDRASLDITAGNVTASFSFNDGDVHVHLSPEIALDAVLRVESGKGNGKSSMSFGGLFGQVLMGGMEVNGDGTFSIAAGVGYRPLHVRGWGEFLNMFGFNLR